MVSRLFAIFISFVLLSSAQAGVTVSPQTILHGLSITMIFSGKNIESDFEKLDKEMLKKNFEIYDIDGDSDRIRLLLYPKKTGELLIPAMRHGQIDFASQVITVVENDEVDIDWNRPTGKAFVNQQVVWQAQVRLDNSANKATLEQHPHANTGLSYHLQSKPYQVEKSILGDTKHFAMSVELSQAGTIKIRTPIIRVKNTSSRAWLFFDETVYLPVANLPSYLPVSTTVGELKLTVDSLPMFVSTGELINLNWQLSGENVPSKFLPNLSQQLGFQKGIEWLSPNQQVSQEWQEQGSINALSVRQPFRVNEIGIYSIPSFRITHFDASSQQLKDIFTDKQYFIVAPSWLVWILGGLIFELVFILLVLLISLLWQVKLRMQLINQLKSSNTESEIWQACFNWSAGLFSNVDKLSIGQWQSIIETHLGHSKALDNLVLELNKNNYSGLSTDLEKAASQWATSLPLLSFKLLPVLFVKWKNDLTVFIERNRKSINNTNH